MKKAIIILVSVILAITLCIGATTVFAQNADRKFVDTNSDGVCDNYALRNDKQSSTGGFTDADGDGICDNYAGKSEEKNKVSKFKDTDGDGICDNYTARNKGQKVKGNGNGRHSRNDCRR